MSESSDENNISSPLQKANIPTQRKYGTREEVFQGYALMTSGKLTKDDIVERNGRLVSKRASETSKLRMNERRAKPAEASAGAAVEEPIKVLPTSHVASATNAAAPVETLSVDAPAKKTRGRPKKVTISNIEPDEVETLDQKEILRELKKLQKWKREMAGFEDAKQLALRSIQKV